MPQGNGLRILFVVLALLASLPSRSSAADSNPVVLLTLEWPPYTGVKLPGNGFVTERVRSAYGTLGQETRFGFFSWRRAMRLPYSDQRFTGFFPAYPTQERKRVCHFSEPVGMSPLGLAQLRNKPLQWARIEDLQPYRLGVVDAYANEDELDRRIQAGQQNVLVSQSDAENLLNLAKGRVAGAVIDSHVFEWVMKNDVRLRPWRDQLQMNTRLLVTWPLFVCFRKDEAGAVLRDHFNTGLANLHEAGKLFPENPVSPAKGTAPQKSP